MRLSKYLFSSAAAAGLLALGIAPRAAAQTPMSLATNAPDKAFGQYFAPKDQVVAIKAGRLYDSKAGKLLPDQVIIIRGDRIAEVGPNLAIPAGAKVIDLSNATVMPGLIDAHVHVNIGGATWAERAYWALNSAQHDLEAGFTTVKDMDSRGGFNTVDLRDMINAGVILGPRMQVVGQSLNNRNMRYVDDPSQGSFYSGRTEGKDVNGPWLARAAVREAKNHGVDYIKIYSTGDYVGSTHLWQPDGSFHPVYTITTEEVAAIVDEAHRLGLKVACHSYGGTAEDPCMAAGVDEPNHILQLNAEGVKIMKEKGLIYVPTIDDIVYLHDEDMKESHGRGSRLLLLEAAVRRAHAAGIQMAFGSGAVSPPGGWIPHGSQAGQFAWLVKWGLSPAEALATSYVGGARTLNYNMEREIGSIEKGKYADVIAVAGDPLKDITEMERVRFVMKGGYVVRDNQSVQ